MLPQNNSPDAIVTEVSPNAQDAIREEWLGYDDEKKLRQVMISREAKYRNGFSQRAVVELALYSGAKVHELVKLNCNDVILSPGSSCLRIPSDSTPRVLPLTREFHNYMTSYFTRKREAGESTERMEPLVCSQLGNRLTLRGWQAAWALALKHSDLIDSSGKPLFNLEIARRTVGRKLYRLANNPHHAQAWLGLDLTTNADRYKPESFDFGIDTLRNLIGAGQGINDLIAVNNPSVELAMGYYNGTIGTMNHMVARRLFLSITPEDPRREMWVARSLMRGRCMFPMDEQRGMAKAKTAIGPVTELAKAGDLFANYLYASALDEGLGLPRDLELSAEKYQECSESGFETAINNLGLKYFWGKGVPRDDEKAFELFAQAASLHEASSMFNLACCYQEGIGTEQDEQKAFRWLKKAAAIGDSRSMNNLSYYYWNGVATPKDEWLAEKWYCMAGTLTRSIDCVVKPGRNIELIRIAG